MSILQTQLLGNTLEAWLAALATVAAAAVAGWLVHRVARAVLLRLAGRSASDLDDRLVSRGLPPLAWLAVLLGVWVAQAGLAMPEAARGWVHKTLLVTAVALAFLLLVRLADVAIEAAAHLYLRGVARRQPDQYDQRASQTARVQKQVIEIANMALGIMGVLTVLATLGVDLTAVWASLGIGGIALVVAVKEPLTNLVGRIYIFGTGIFDEGHFIVFEQWAGTVTQVGMFRTHLETFSDMTTVSIPNAKFITGVVKNYFGRSKFMFKWDLSAPYDTTPDQLDQLIAALDERLRGLPEVNGEMCWVYLDRLDDYAKVVRVWFQARLGSWAESLAYGSRVLQDIQGVFAGQGVEFAFPTQTLHLEGLELPPGAPAPQGEGRDQGQPAPGGQNGQSD